MQTSGSNTSLIISVYRKDQTIDTLIRIHNVTGQEFPVSGDAPLRMKASKARAKLRLNKLYGTAVYQDTDSIHLP